MGALTTCVSMAIAIGFVSILTKMMASDTSTARSYLGVVGIFAAALGGLFLLPQLFSRATGDHTSGDTTPTPSPAPTPSTTPASSAQPTPDIQPANTFHPDWTLAAGILAILVGIVLLVAIAAALWHLIATHRTSRRDAHLCRQDQIPRWETGQRVFRTVSQQLTEFEMDDEAVHFSRHLLADITEPLTAAFHEAFSKASALNLERSPSDDAQITAFVTAADETQRAFGAANDNALRKARVGIISGDRQLTSDEQRRLSQARKLLNQALDPSSTHDEATTAQTKAYRILDEVGVVVPERLKARTIRSIEALHKPELTAVARKG